LFEKLEVEESHGPVSYCLKFFNFTKGFSNLQQTHKYLQTQQGSSIKFDQRTPSSKINPKTKTVQNMGKKNSKIPETQE
jgi:hypothetical protein